MTLREKLDAVFAAAAERRENYPHVSHILGADWIVGLGWQGGDPVRYRELAYRVAAMRERS